MANHSVYKSHFGRTSCFSATTLYVRRASFYVVSFISFIPYQATILLILSPCSPVAVLVAKLFKNLLGWCLWRRRVSIPH